MVTIGLSKGKIGAIQTTMPNKIKPAIIFLGGPDYMKTHLQSAKKSGFFSILIDYNPDCHCRNFCDTFINISIVNMDQNSINLIKNEVKENHWSIINIIPCGEIAYQSTIGIGEVFNINFQHLELAFKRNKLKKMSKSSKGFEMPNGGCNLDNLNIDINKNYFIKDKYSCAGSGVRKVPGIELNKLTASDLKDRYIEEEVIGSHIRAGGYSFDKEYFHDVIVDVFFDDKLRYKGMISPPNISNIVVTKIKKIFSFLSSQISINTPISADFIINKDQVFLIDISFNFGSHNYQFSKHLNGLSAVKKFYNKISIGNLINIKSKKNSVPKNFFGVVIIWNKLKTKRILDIDCKLQECSLRISKGEVYPAEVKHIATCQLKAKTYQEVLDNMLHFENKDLFVISYE